MDRQLAYSNPYSVDGGGSSYCGCDGAEQSCEVSQGSLTPPLQFDPPSSGF